MRLEISKKQVQTQTCSPRMQQALQMLRMNALELNEYVVQSALENPVLELEDAGDPFRVESFSEPLPSAFAQSRQQDVYREFAGPVSLREELRQQLNLEALTPPERRAANTIIDGLDARGYLTDSLSDIQTLCAVSHRQAEKALAAIQSLEPAGVGARSLSECLCLQLERQGVRDPALYRMAREFLEEIASHKYARVAAALGITAKQSRAYAERLRRLDPGVAGMEEEAVQYIYPEVVVVKNQRTLEVRVAEHRLPKLRINTQYRRNAGLDAESRAYLKEQYAGANRVVSALNLWKSMVQRVAEKIVEAQAPFFLDNRPLRPMRMEDVAAALGVHRSTVSRAAAGKHVSCEQGVFPLKYFFSRCVPSRQRGALSSDEVRRRIRQLLQDDSSLSDSRLSALLEEEGIRIARRTVAKYRLGMGIRPSYGRKWPAAAKDTDLKETRG